MADFTAWEVQEGVRFVWNAWPASRAAAQQLAVPLGVFVSPLRCPDDIQQVAYEPVRCRQCGGCLNPYCLDKIDFKAKVWVCVFCESRNVFPGTYQQISPETLPPELFSNNTLMDYALGSVPSGPAAYVFVLDGCLSRAEMAAMVRGVQHALSMVPDGALISLLTFSSHVVVHELGPGLRPRSWCLRGEPALEAHDLLALLGLRGGSRASANGTLTAAGTSAVGRFLVPATECASAVQDILDSLGELPAPPKTKRHERCTGNALATALALLEVSVPRSGARIMLFTGGPCTSGPGKVVGLDLEETMRSHMDLEKRNPNTVHHRLALTFYEGLGARMVEHGYCLDLFACSLDQVGLCEMKSLVGPTGGRVVLADEFQSDAFRESLARLMELGLPVVLESDEGIPEEVPGVVHQGHNATIEVFCQPGVRVAGALGPCASLGRAGRVVAETPLGMGGTSAWKMGALDLSSSVCVFFDLDVGGRGQPMYDHASALVVQFQTRYRIPDGQERLRVQTVARTWVAATATEIRQGFDQEAAAVAIARLAVWKLETGERAVDVLAWLDRTAVDLCTKYGTYTPRVQSSFSLSEEFRLFPQMVFHLRRSQFMQVFNNTPDETVFYRVALLREPVSAAIVMIQPTLFTYGFQGPPKPMLLDASALKHDHILLLDTWFMVIIHCGSQVASWRTAGYQDQPEHHAFRQLLEAPMEDARQLLEDTERIPVPKLLECDQGTSQSRFVLAKLNPSMTHMNSAFTKPGEVIFTEDISIEKFMEGLSRLAVNAK